MDFARRVIVFFLILAAGIPSGPVWALRALESAESSPRSAGLAETLHAAGLEEDEALAAYRRLGQWEMENDPEGYRVRRPAQFLALVGREAKGAAELQIFTGWIRTQGVAAHHALPWELARTLSEQLLEGDFPPAADPKLLARQLALEQSARGRLMLVNVWLTQFQSKRSEDGEQRYDFQAAAFPGQKHSEMLPGGWTNEWGWERGEFIWTLVLPDQVFSGDYVKEVADLLDPGEFQGEPIFENDRVQDVLQRFLRAVGDFQQVNAAAAWGALPIFVGEPDGYHLGDLRSIQAELQSRTDLFVPRPKKPLPRTPTPAVSPVRSQAADRTLPSPAGQVGVMELVEERSGPTESPPELSPAFFEYQKKVVSQAEGSGLFLLGFDYKTQMVREVRIRSKGEEQSPQIDWHAAAFRDGKLYLFSPGTGRLAVSNGSTRSVKLFSNGQSSEAFHQQARSRVRSGKRASDGPGFSESIRFLNWVAEGGGVSDVLIEEETQAETLFDGQPVSLGRFQFRLNDKSRVYLELTRAGIQSNRVSPDSGVDSWTVADLLRQARERALGADIVVVDAVVIEGNTHLWHPVLTELGRFSGRVIVLGKLDFARPLAHRHSHPILHAQERTELAMKDALRAANKEGRARKITYVGPENQPELFQPVQSAAVSLGLPVIRVERTLKALLSGLGVPEPEAGSLGAGLEEVLSVGRSV